MPLSSNQAFLLVIAGCLPLYYELLRPGNYVSGPLGLAAVLSGSYELSAYGVTGWGFSLITGAMLLFLVEIFQKTYFTAGLLATALLATGFCGLIRGRAAICPALAIPVCLVFGLLTSFLASGIRRGRSNKRNDLRTGAN